MRIEARWDRSPGGGERASSGGAREGGREEKQLKVSPTELAELNELPDCT